MAGIAIVKNKGKLKFPIEMKFGNASNARFMVICEAIDCSITKTKVLLGKSLLDCVRAGAGALKPPAYWILVKYSPGSNYCFVATGLSALS